MIEEMIRQISGCPDSVITHTQSCKLHCVELRGPERPWTDPHSIPLVKGHVAYLQLGDKVYQLPLEFVRHMIAHKD